jgi:hypothetical protein
MIFTTNIPARKKIEYLNDKNLLPRANKKGMMARTTQVSATPFQGKPSSQAGTLEGSITIPAKKIMPRINRKEFFVKIFDAKVM